MTCPPLNLSIPHRPSPGRRWAAAAIFIFLSVFAAATTVRPPEFHELVNGSDYVIRARVKSVRSEFVTPGSKKIRTKVELEVTEVIAGQPPATVVLELLGGKVGDSEMIIEGAPTFTEGDEDILFVSGNGRTASPLYAMMHGRYPVRRDAASGREYVTRSNQVPLQNTAEVVLPMTNGAAAQLQRQRVDPSRALTPGDFARQVREVLDPEKRRARQN